MAIRTGPIGIAAGVDKGNQGVRWCPDHCLKVYAGIRQRRDWQSSLFTQLQHGARRGESGAWGGTENSRFDYAPCHRDVYIFLKDQQCYHRLSRSGQSWAESGKSCDERTSCCSGCSRGCHFHLLDIHYTYTEIFFCRGQINIFLSEQGRQMDSCCAWRNDFIWVVLSGLATTHCVGVQFQEAHLDFLNLHVGSER